MRRGVDLAEALSSSDSMSWSRRGHYVLGCMPSHSTESNCEHGASKRPEALPAASVIQLLKPNNANPRYGLTTNDGQQSSFLSSRSHMRTNARFASLSEALDNAGP